MTDFDARQSGDHLRAYGLGHTVQCTDPPNCQTPDRLKKSTPLAWLDCEDLKYHLVCNTDTDGDGETECTRYNFGSYQDHTICINNTELSDMCQGDSGGPVLRCSKQYGVNSFVLRACAEMPSASISVAHFMDWIITQTGYNPAGPFFT